MEVLKQVHPRGPNSFREVQEIETPDEQTVILRLEHPAPYMMTAFSSYESPIVPKHLFEGNDLRNLPYANAPLGSGPYKFVEMETRSIHPLRPLRRLLQGRHARH